MRWLFRRRAKAAPASVGVQVRAEHCAICREHLTWHEIMDKSYGRDDDRLCQVCTSHLKIHHGVI